MLDNARQAGDSNHYLSPSDLREFERLFVDWLDSGSNRDQIEMGGAGDVRSLVQAMNRDEVLKKMLNTPPKPHKPVNGSKAKSSDKGR